MSVPVGGAAGSIIFGALASEQEVDFFLSTIRFVSVFADDAIISCQLFTCSFSGCLCVRVCVCE